MKTIKAAIFVALFALLGACASGTAELRAQAETRVGDSAAPKRIVLMMDGTGNDARSATSVWRLKEMIKAGDPDASYAYFSGVGTAGPRLTGNVLAIGMEDIVQQAYNFLAANYRPGDSVYVFGFSRGAHQARAFVGFVAYAGLISAPDWQRHAARYTNRMLELTKDYDDDWFARQWAAGNGSTVPPLAQQIKDSFGVSVAAVPIEFVGLWDTVPGSWFKTYGACAELPDSRKGQRYKTGSYPNTRRIAHAVAADEKRSMFQPILLCDPIAPDRTSVREVWFPGAHADIGGGYDDDPDLGLPNLALGWMLDQLDASWRLPVTPRPVGDALALAHWSMGDLPGNLNSTCIDRVVPSQPERLHPSLVQRRQAGKGLIRMSGTTAVRVDPPTCGNR